MSRALHFSMKGSDVENLQRQLNCCDPTRLPRSTPDGGYGVLTMARVMEFQSQQGLGTDGVAGSGTFAKLSGTPTTCPSAAAPKGRCIVVDLINRKLFAFLNGSLTMTSSPIHGGSTQDPSHRGVFVMSNRRLRNHTSSRFPTPVGNMNFAMFYNGGEAIHQGAGDRPSHGCIHVNPPDAERLFNWVAGNDIIVIVVKLTP